MSGHSFQVNKGHAVDGVGLIHQIQRKAILLPDNIVADADMEAADTSAWLALAGMTLSKSTASPHGGARALRGTNASASNQYLYQSGTWFNGTTYYFEGWARGDGGSGYPLLRRGDGGLLWTGTTSASWQFFSVTADPTTNNFFRLYTMGGVGTWVEWDDFYSYES